MAQKYTCPKTGIRFEGELVAKELGIVPEPVETVLGPIRIEVKPSDLPRQNEFTTELGVTFRGEELPGRVRGDVPVGASMANFLAPERPRGTRLMNRTMQEVMEDWDYQAGRQRDAVERGRKDRRFDPVTETYY